mmetsp:Transcript_17948/g.43030  ORF Transcript_17948/g.43030 Transcript_17948/m.43030 type:complete len:96 (+) Transcript_17948:411-698(+)
MSESAPAPPFSAQGIAPRPRRDTARLSQGGSDEAFLLDEAKEFLTVGANTALQGTLTGEKGGEGQGEERWSRRKDVRMTKGVRCFLPGLPQLPLE